jgi:hypothetical protein
MDEMDNGEHQEGLFATCLETNQEMVMVWHLVPPLHIF